jgi:glycosyltransferase involved in cell wall biosynthesis
MVKMSCTRRCAGGKFVTILHVLEPFASGIVTAVTGIAGELSDCRHIVVHGSRNWVDSLESVKSRFPSGVEFIEWKSAVREISLSGDFRALMELAGFFKPYRNSSDVVIHLHSSKAGFLGRLAARLLGIKTVIYTPHCGAFLRKDISVFKRKLYLGFEWIGGRFGGRVVGCGPSEGELYRRLGKNTAYVSNGARPRKSHSGVPRTLVSFSGIVSFQKDPALWNTVASLCAGKARRDGFSFCWIGEGPLSGKLDRNFVTVTGWKGPAEVEQFLDKTLVYLSTAAWEGLPYGVLEAMNASCALLLRNVPGNRDLVVPGENGRLFDTEEEAVSLLEQMLSGAEKTALMGKKSFEILEKKFSLKAMGEGYRNIYQESLSTAGKLSRIVNGQSLPSGGVS